MTESTSVTILVKRDGPYIVSLEDVPRVRLLDHEGNTLTPEPDRVIKLCRCGHSARKPFCDGSHRSAGFSGETAAPPMSGGSAPG